MRLPSTIGDVTPERRVALFFFAQFLSVGVANGFAGIWFAQRGLSAADIGVLNAAPVAVLLVIGLLVGRLADRAHDWRVVIVRGAIASALFPLGLLIVDGFWGYLVVWTLAVASQWAIVPVADAAALRLSQRRGANFGAFRALGTAGYLLALATAGFVLARAGADAFLVIFIGACACRGLASLVLPNLRATPPVRCRKASLAPVLRPWFLMPLAGWALVYATHLILNGFQALIWLNQGLATETISLLIALGALAETAVFVLFKRHGPKLSTRALLLVVAAASVLRWLALAAAPGVPVLVGLQLMHGITYALGFLASATFIAENTREDVAAEAQSLLTVMEQALAIPALLVFGWLAATFGAGAYLFSAGVALLGAVAICSSLRLAAPSNDG